MENGDETLASHPAAAEKTAPNGGVVEEEVPAAHAAKSYAAVAAENAAPNGGVAEEEDGVAATYPAKSYAAVAAHAEIENLRAAKLALEEKLAEARRENEAVAAEAHRIEGIFVQAREEADNAEDAASSTEKEVASLRAEVERLQAVLTMEKGEHELDKRKHEELTKEVEAVRQEKLKLEEEIKTLKACAATAKEREAAPMAEAPKEVEVAWQGMAAAAAAGAAVTAAVVLVYLRLKR